MRLVEDYDMETTIAEDHANGAHAPEFWPTGNPWCAECVPVAEEDRNAV